MIDRHKHKTDFLIRPFTPEDQVVTRRLILEGLGEHFGYIDESLNPDLEDIGANYLDKGHVFLVVELEGNIVGTGALVQEQVATGRLVRMSVKQAYRRQGIGRKVATQLLEIAGQQGFDQILVETNHDWYGAIGLYQSLGFDEYDRDQESIHMSLRIK